MCARSTNGMFRAVARQLCRSALGDRADIDEHAAELAAALALLLERLLELLLGDQLLLEQQVAEADALAGFGSHGSSVAGGGRREP